MCVVGKMSKDIGMGTTECIRVNGASDKGQDTLESTFHHATKAWPGP